MAHPISDVNRYKSNTFQSRFIYIYSVHEKLICKLNTCKYKENHCPKEKLRVDGSELITKLDKRKKEKTVIKRELEPLQGSIYMKACCCCCCGAPRYNI